MVGKVVTYRAYTPNGMVFREGRVLRALPGGEYEIASHRGRFFIHASAILGGLTP